MTRQRATFVHLIRDGRDMAFSRNRNNLAKYPRFGGQVVGVLGVNYNHCFYRADCAHSIETDYVCMVMQIKLWERINMKVGLGPILKLY